MKEIHIIDISQYARQLLDNHSTWTIHSRYNKTVNISSDDCILAIQTAGSPISPLSILVDSTSMNFMQSASDEKPIFSNTFLCCNATIYNDILSPLPHLESASFSTLLMSISKAIDESNTNGFDLLFKGNSDDTTSDKITNDLLLNASKNILLSAEKYFTISIPSANDWKECAEKLSSLTGIGIGLTPSGDDFLTGVLAGCILANKTDQPIYQQLRNALPRQLYRTNEISAAFIKCALEGRFSQHICNIGANSNAKQLLSDFQRVGHSSGIDTLCGIYWIMKNIF